MRADTSAATFAGSIFADLGVDLGPASIDGGELNEISGQINFNFELLPALAEIDGLIFLQQFGDGDEATRALEQSPLWAALPAVQEGRVVRVDADTWLQGSTISAELLLDDVLQAVQA